MNSTGEPSKRPYLGMRLEYLENAQTTKSDPYVAQLMRFKKEITKRQFHMKKPKVIFHQNMYRDTGR